MTPGHEELDVCGLSTGYSVKEEPSDYGFKEIDFDPEETKSRADAVEAHSSRQ